MSDAQKSALKRLWPVYGIHLQDALLDFKKIFPTDAPTILEIGFGNGDTLVSLAKTHSEKNFMGVDVHQPGIGALFLKLETHHLTQVRVFCADALDVLHIIPDESLEAVYLLFPDPWPKRRHHKRRIVQPAVVELIQKKLIIQGKFHIATDWDDYAHHISHVVSENAHLKLLPCVNKNRPITKFEAKGKTLGHTVWDFMFEKIG